MKLCIEDMEMVEKMIQLSILLARQDLISAFFPVSLLVDIFDVKTLDFCENLFGFVEINVNVFKEQHFFTPCKNSLLRMCNDLLRRLSRSQNTVFCGRILMFLANFFPFSERSGLNIVSEFNIENTTEFEYLSKIENRDDDMMTENPITRESSPIKIDGHLYLKFWALQEFFRCPYMCYDKEKYQKFNSFTKDVLGAFKSFKLEEADGQSDKIMSQPQSNERYKCENNFFAKFLTNPKLLALQLGDSNFRRTILVQYLVIFQYLVSTIKFKGENDKLNEQQQEWVRETEISVYKLLDETPPKGQEFSNAMRHILKREEIWNNWKNEGCKEIKRPDGYDNITVLEQKKRKLLGNQIYEVSKAGKFDLGNQELSRLWNLSPDNLQACKGSDRNFLPPLETYLENKEKTDPSYEWRALRLVSRQSSHFFTLLAPPNEKIEKISDYLKLFNQKIQKEKTEFKADTTGGIELVESQTENFVDDNENTEGIDETEEDDDKQQHKVTKATPKQICEISKAIGNDWQRLGYKLGIEKDVLEYYTTKNSNAPCEIMLTNWFKEDDDDASLENINYTLEGLDMMEAASLVKKMIDTE